MHQTVFLAGASGAVGRRLVPLLIEAGHTVYGTTRASERATRLEEAGVRPVVVDVFNSQALEQAVCAARPTVIIHQLTDLAQGLAGDQDKVRAANARLRREGTTNLVRAALAAGVRRVVAQSIAWAYAPGPVPHAEDQPLDVMAQGSRGTTIVNGVVPLECAVLDMPGFEGIVLRYGQLYGPGTWAQAPDGSSPVHVDAAAYAAFLAIDRGAPGAYNIADDGSEVSNAKAVALLGWLAAFRLADGKVQVAS